MFGTSTVNTNEGDESETQNCSVNEMTLPDDNKLQKVLKYILAKQITCFGHFQTKYACLFE